MGLYDFTQMGLLVAVRPAQVPRLVTAEPVVRGQSVDIGQQNSDFFGGFSCSFILWGLKHVETTM